MERQGKRPGGDRDSDESERLRKKRQEKPKDYLVRKREVGRKSKRRYRKAGQQILPRKRLTGGTVVGCVWRSGEGLGRKGGSGRADFGWQTTRTGTRGAGPKKDLSHNTGRIAAAT